MEKICAYCGQAFAAKGRARFCSDAHRVMGFRKNKGLPITPFSSDQISSKEVEKLREKIRELETQNQSYFEGYKEVKAIYEKAKSDYMKSLDGLHDIILAYYLNPNQKPEAVEQVRDYLVKWGKLP